MRYRQRDFEVLGFPCNQFGAQEPGEADEIAGFCQKNYGVSFPAVCQDRCQRRGTRTRSTSTLKRASPGLLGSEGIMWNFTKFLVNRQGEVSQRYAPTTTPDAIAGDIEALL
jgi:glutathione peroxidase